MSLLSQASICITPNGYKEGKLYSVIPSDGSGDMSVTRATTATRVNSAGLVELVPYNFVLNSETTWVTNGVTITSGITDPNGGTNAYQVSGIASGNVTDYVVKGSNPMPLTSGSTITFSVYMKGSGTIGTAMERSVGGTYFFNTKVHTLTNQWQRFTHTFTPSNDSLGFSIYVTNLTGTTATSVDIAFPQVVFGTSALDYQKTETRLNIPRLDYSNGTCPSLLVEPQRTNILNYSEDFENGYWYEEPGNSVTSNTTISPSGIQNADTITAVAGSEMNVHNYNAFPLNAGTYTYSIYLKNNGTNLISVYLFQISFGFAARGEINFSAETFTASVGTGTIENVGNGWYRVTLTNSVSSGTFTTGVYSTDTTGTRSVYAWGAQLEAGNYSTSYIPTTSASVTRNADVISKTSISSLIGQTEGTLFFDSYVTITGDSSSYAGILLNNGTSSNVIAVGYYQDGRIQAAVFVSGSLLVNIDLPSFGLTNGKHKFALAYKLNDYVFYVDGIEVGSDTSATVPATSVFNLSDLFGGANISHNAVALWKTRLTNDQLEALTGTGFNTYAEMASYYNYVLQ
jgi:hypothetical protein